MWFRSLFKSLTRSSRRCQQRAADHKLQARRLLLEGLEDRRLLAFLPAVNYAAGTNPQAVVAGDFNNDAVLDLAVANDGASTVSVLLGNSNGTFQAAQDSATGNYPQSLAVGDFNADGKLDLATANAGDVSVMLGNGNGTFLPPTNIDIGSRPQSVAVGDFNSDGKLDLGVTSNVYYPGSATCDPYTGWCTEYPGGYNGHVNVLLGNGLGSFAPAFASYPGSGYHTSAAIADFNGDLNLDFAAIDADYGTVSVLLGTGSGAFEVPTYFDTGWYAQAVTVGDFTSDGILDIATAGNTVDILPGYGDGTFRPVVRQYVDPVALAPADFNGDGNLDLVTADYSNTVSVLLGTGTGTLTLPLDFTAGSLLTAVAVGDFNGDGRPDVAAANAGSNNVSVLLNAGNWPPLDAPAITIADAAAVTEGHTGTVNANFTVSLSAPYNQPVSVVYSTQDSSATGGSDYETKSETLTFNPGETSKIVSISVNGDSIGEPSESFFVNLSDPLNAYVTDATGQGTILDDEPYVWVGSAASIPEGNSGQTAMTFTLHLSALYPFPVSVDYTTVDGSALAGSDYVAVAGTATIAANTTSQTITVQVNGDSLAEGDEYLAVNITAVSGAIVSGGWASGTIVNDDM